MFWDRDGYALWQKRLEAGVFKVALVDGYETVTGVDLKELLSGVDFARIKFRKSAEKACTVDLSMIKRRSDTRRIT